MIVVFAEIFIGILFWVEEELACQKLESHASQGPHICRKIVLGTQEYLRTTVLTCLDLGREMVMLPTSVAQVCDLHLEALGKTTLGIIERDLVFEVLKQFLYSLLFSFGFVSGLF